MLFAAIISGPVKNAMPNTNRRKRIGCFRVSASHCWAQVWCSGFKVSLRLVRGSIPIACDRLNQPSKELPCVADVALRKNQHGNALKVEVHDDCHEADRGRL